MLEALFNYSACYVAVQYLLRPFIKGHVVTATGSSKKIAKNLAAKMMLDKLEEVALSSVMPRKF